MNGDVGDAEVAAKVMSESLERAKQLVREASGVIRNSVSRLTGSADHCPEVTLLPDQPDHSTPGQSCGPFG